MSGEMELSTSSDLQADDNINDRSERLSETTNDMTSNISTSTPRTWVLAITGQQQAAVNKYIEERGNVEAIYTKIVMIGQDWVGKKCVAHRVSCITVVSR